MNNNEQPSYILKTVEDISLYKNPKTPMLKKAIIIILAVLILGSFIFGENLFTELSFLSKTILIGLVLGILLIRRTEEVPFPLELHFYKDRIEIHRKEVHYSNGKVKRELYIFRYVDSPVCIYDPRTRFMRIKGMAHGEWYLYSKDGTVSDKPKRIRDMEGISYFRISKTANVDVVAEIEKNSPIKVKIENNLI